MECTIHYPTWGLRSWAVRDWEVGGWKDRHLVCIQASKGRPHVQLLSATNVRTSDRVKEMNKKKKKKEGTKKKKREWCACESVKHTGKKKRKKKKKSRKNGHRFGFFFFFFTRSTPLCGPSGGLGTSHSSAEMDPPIHHLSPAVPLVRIFHHFHNITRRQARILPFFFPLFLRESQE